LCAQEDNFQYPVVDFIHLSVFSESQLDEEDVLDFVLYVEVMLQSLKERFAHDVALYP
jgi:hypothetical protein